MDQTPFSLDEIRAIRYEVSKPYLNGSGMEVGAGANPQRLPDGVQCRYFDKYDRNFVEHFFGEGRELPYQVTSLADVTKHFPDGADFLIAHNVLEHCENPIRTVCDWISYIRPGGVLVVGLPLPSRCLNDGQRRFASFRHVLEDYLFDRTQEDFESCEHIYSFRLGWRDDKAALSKDEYLDFMLAEGQRKGHDLHWHAGGHDLWSHTIHAALHFSGRSYTLLDTTQDPEALFVFRVGETGASAIPPFLESELNHYRPRLKLAADRLDRCGELPTDLQSLLREAQRSVVEAEQLRQELDRMRLSRSWRMTAPLRSLLAFARRHGVTG